MTCPCKGSGLYQHDGSFFQCLCTAGATRRIASNRKALDAYRLSNIEPVIRPYAAVRQEGMSRLEREDSQVLQSFLLGLIIGACGLALILNLLGRLP